VTEEATAGLEDYDAYRAATSIERFVDDLSNWYVRRSRRRFWRAGSDTDKAAAYATLYHVMTTLVRLLAPFMPFLAEAIYQNLVRSVNETAPESVHHTDWPQVETARRDEDLLRDMGLGMRVAALGRSARSSAGIKLRQPLHRAVVLTREHGDLSHVMDIVADELNVKELEMVSDDTAIVEHKLLPENQALGPRFGPLFPKVRAALQAADAAAVVRTLQAGQPWSLTIDGMEVDLAPGEVLIQTTPRPGLAVASEGGLTVAVDTRLTAELIQEGLAREAVRRVQELRKSAGLEMDDRIHLSYTATPDLAAALQTHAGYLRDETLAVEIAIGSAPEGATAATDVFEEETFSFALVKAKSGP
jgi:isoleucyl-tRNA synthetase